MSQVRTIVCFRQRSSTILFGFAFDFLQFAKVKSLKIFTICEICPPDHLKAEKIGVTEEVSRFKGAWAELICQASKQRCWWLPPAPLFGGILTPLTLVWRHINSAHAPLNRDDDGLLPDAYLQLIRKKKAAN